MMADGGFSVEGSENIQELNWDLAYQISMDFYYSLSNENQSVHIFYSKLWFLCPHLAIHYGVTF